jgi:hypothetical protein
MTGDAGAKHFRAMIAGVSRLRSGMRHTVEIIFHDAK